MSVRRSCLSIPGSSEKMLAKAGELQADEVVIDLEDSVAPGAKAEARELVCRVLAEGRPGPSLVAVRVNALDSPWYGDDVDALVERAGPAVDSLVVPKVERAEDVLEVGRMLDERGASMGIQALVETAAGLLRVGEIATASQRVETLILGHADLAASLRRANPEQACERWLYAQEAVLVAARAAGVEAIDGPFLAIADEEGLRRWAEHVRDLGYDGKWAIHPSQLALINQTFTPSDDELDRARDILAALAQAESDAARGAVQLDGKMIDEASRKQAERVVARAGR
ncbi:MAG TPA: CoA ester lyase [Thermoleophilaceae bacterium]|nr:CoA ester lyase [Thermoleophilaceae bacterium]